MYYRKALRTARASSPALNRCRDSVTTLSPGQYSRVSVIFKISLCLEELGDWDAAVKELQAIPRSNRNATINSFLGRLYQRLGRKKRAIESYKVATAHNCSMNAHCYLSSLTLQHCSLPNEYLYSITMTSASSCFASFSIDLDQSEIGTLCNLHTTGDSQQHIPSGYAGMLATATCSN